MEETPKNLVNPVDTIWLSVFALIVWMVPKCGAFSLNIFQPGNQYGGINSYEIAGNVK